MAKGNIYPVILSGGTGTRLWPLSRALYPKQLQPLHSELSLLQETASRLSGDQFAKPLIICNQEHRFIVAEHLQAIDIQPEAIVLEPIGRNTAPAAAVAAIILAEHDPEAVILLMPSDHVIRDSATFQAAIEAALPVAENGALVTFGIQPTSPETGYGYIKKSDAIADQPGCFAVEAFVEKPDLATAEIFLEEGSYFWNGGIFLFTVANFMAELERSSPEIAAACREAVQKSITDMDFHRLDEESFAACPSNSIDYAVMEKSENVAVVPVDMGWSDVGSWDALWQVLDKDGDGNVTSGDVILKGTSNSLIRSEDKLVTAVGLSDTIIVATEDAILVSSKEDAQDVKLIVDELKSQERLEHISHAKVYRPWGWYQTLERRDRFQVKVISLKPSAKISLQRHQQRAEHWVVVSGIATVTRGEEVIELEENQSTYIPIGMMHRLENLTKDELQIIEVQSGDYLGEDDIERFDDKYGRD
ncbi:MAG: mannose-1-phosphate guanylyltransferase/mannose-6-phosphate isomerase [Rhodospirillaceae bacterium]|jgi:mannose-1-phosphate guanylyltransferase / mannose-6-phosphate isomerase|nr:mannose-1-phosphate guanylyltransferase/mannose-6-phosphate isomerase [Rhodospirillaceae bacterium]MBT5939229.1 mannose-1-phosphate guanylyltransferase/mannose-6-phosphate isomerase [Rhodospirillaceae bacterium]MBT7268646.1 mannose-1-phosphate guanylyltransferase/mannose-6-phosphate isomerase [Rhodospirillaceae bacterium]